MGTTDLVHAPWPKDPPFTDFGRSESARLADIRNVVPCQPGGPIFAMWNLGLLPLEIPWNHVKPEAGA